MLNVIAVMGRVVADPDLRKTTTGISTTTFTIACDRNFAKSGSERQTDFLDIVAWRQSAEFASKYFKKGQLVAVNGSLQTRSYEDKNGNKRKVYEIVAEHLNFAESRRSDGVSGKNTDDNANDFKVIDEAEDLPF